LFERSPYHEWASPKLLQKEFLKERPEIPGWPSRKELPPYRFGKTLRKLLKTLKRGL